MYFIALNRFGIGNFVRVCVWLCDGSDRQRSTKNQIATFASHFPFDQFHTIRRLLRTFVISRAMLISYQFYLRS